MGEVLDLVAPAALKKNQVLLIEYAQDSSRTESFRYPYRADGKKVRIRYRIDGALYEKARYDVKIMPALVARLKIVGGMDISEKRKPQDGRITQVVDRIEYDIYVSILPTVFGEKIVMRLASKTALNREKSRESCVFMAVFTFESG